MSQALALIIFAFMNFHGALKILGIDNLDPLETQIFDAPLEKIIAARFMIISGVSFFCLGTAMFFLPPQ